MLDYMGENEFLRPYSMFRNRHRLLALCAGFSLLISFLLVPLSSGLFQAHTVLFDSTVNPQVLSAFDASLYSALVLANNLSFGTAIQWAGASLNHGADFPTWTTVNATFPKLAIDYTNASNFGSNYSLPINASSADLDCVANNDSFKLDSNIAEFNFTDRGCQIQTSVTIQPQKVMIQGWTTKCSESSGFNRINFLSSRRDYPKTDIVETSFVACIPHYLRQPGTLRIQNGSIDFSPGNEAPSNIDPKNTFLSSYAFQLLLPAVLDPDANFAGSDFTSLIYGYSSQVSGEQDSLSPLAMMKSTREVFQSVFSIMGNIYLQRALDPAQAPSADATVSTASTRLFVYWVFGYTIVSFMAINVIILFVVAHYSHVHPSILHEAPIGLIGHASIAHQSDLGELIDCAAKWPQPNEPTGAAPADNRPNHGNPNGNRPQLNGNATGADQRGPPTPGPRNRKILETLKDRKILEDPRWRGNWKVQDWGSRDERLIRC